MLIENLSIDQANQVEQLLDVFREDSPSIRSLVFMKPEKSTMELLEEKQFPTHDDRIDLLEAKIQRLEQTINNIFGGHILLNGNWVSIDGI